MKEWFLARDYRENVANEKINKVIFGKSQFRRKNSENGIPFVTTYHPKVKKIGKLLKYLLTFFYSNEEIQNIFSSLPMVSYRSVRKIKYYILRSKFYPLDRSVV